MIHIASTFVADVLNDSLKAILHKFCTQEIVFHYNQIFQQALLPTSEFNENQSGVNVILIRLADLFNPAKKMHSTLNDLITALISLQKSSHAPILLFITPSQSSTIKEKNHYLRLEKKLKSELTANTNTLFISSEEILKINKNALIFDPFTEKHGHIPYTQEFYDSLAWLIGRKYFLFSRKPYKVIVLDCDGTLWDGIIEEDGLSGIVINAEYQAFHQFMIDLFKAGFLICLCSKNSEKSVLDVLNFHKKMVLDSEKHICSYRINWNLKSVNIQSLAKELNLGLDSFIFIDDNAIECAEVKAALPEVLVIELPPVNSGKESTLSRLDYLQAIWAFDVHNISEEDKKRTQFYKQNRLRETLQSESISYEQFLKNLKIKTSIREALPQDLERVIQLSQRTNQFNLSPKGVSPSEFNERVLQHKSPRCLIIEVSDKYGDYGLVGVAVYDIESKELVIKNFFLSCRILGRGIEYAVIQHLVKIAEQYSLKKMKLLFSITERNIPGIGFIQHLYNQDALQHLNQVTLSLDTLKKIKPKLIQQEKSKSTKSDISGSNDYLLDIAKEYLNRKYTSSRFNQLATVEMSLIELFRQHKLWVDEKNVSFIELGITSLDSVLLGSTIYQRFNVEINPFDLLKPDFTFEKLTKNLLGQLKTNHFVPDFSMEDAVISLSSTQLRLWEDEQILPDTARNNMFIAYEINGTIDKNVLTNAFMQLITRHDALRFSFFSEKEGPFLKVNSLNSIKFKLDYYSSNNDAEIEKYVVQFRQKPFSLSNPPLFRAALVIKNKNKTLFLFSIHHIIHDGWSLNILLRELSDIYNASLQKITLPSVVEACPYLDFIRWQKAVISDEVLEKQRAFWKKYLSHIPKLELVYDKARREEQEKPVSQRITFKLSKKTTQKIKKISLESQVTIYDSLLSIFGLFLSHLANQDDVNFVTATSGRHHASVADVIGFFTNLVLVRLHFNSQETFGDLIKKNQKIIHSIFNNQDLPFNEIMSLTGEQVNSKIHAFNQVGFIFQSYPINHLTINNKTGKRIYGDDKAELVYDACNECRFGNLVFYMQEYEEKIQGMVEYNTLLFEKERIKNMIDSFKTLIMQCVETKNIPARSIPLLSAKQHYRLLHQWNQAQLSYFSKETVLSNFREQVLMNKNAIAIVHNDSQLTYGELDNITNQLARKLKKEGVYQEAPIGIFLEKNITRIVAILSIIKAGGAYVPLEVDSPFERINYIIEDSAIALIIASHKTASYINSHFPEINMILVDNKSIQQESPLPLTDTTSPTQLAYILYTSGSTGKPKGVAIEQRGILRLVKSPDYINIKAEDRIAQASTFTFDAAIFEIWGALLNGASVVLIDKQVLLDAALLNGVIKTKKISIMFLTTQLFHTYIQLFPQLFQNLNYLLVGGEIMLPEAVESLFKQKNRPRCFMNVYGPTENTTFSTSYLIQKNCDLHKPIPIGKPISATQTYVLNEYLNPTPVGVPGTLYVGGAGLARGYLNREELNNEKFTYQFNERLYNTGDLVIWQPDGNLRYLGRKDNQVKINGYRIELDEIALELETHHLVVQAIVLVKTTEHHRQLVSYVLLEKGHDLRDINLYHYLKTILPHYMLPKFYYQIDSIPITDNGKVDKKLLLKSEFPAISYTQYESATNILQENLISIYAEILHIPPTEISINAEFFDLGGTSITALHLIDKVNEKFNITINFSTLYEHASVKSLSEKIRTLSGEKKDNLAINFTRLHDSALKVINEGNPQKTPLIFVHPIGGTGFCYLDLIKLLPHNQPCYIIQDPSIDANLVLFEDISAMAKCYNKLLLKHFKCKKIILGGYSFGGMLSLEMVSQLEQQKLDKAIERVITFDTWVVSDFLNVEAKEALKLSILQQYERVETNLINQHIDPKPWMELYYRRLQDLGFAYKPPKINKKIMLFKANQQLGEFSAMKDKTNYLNNHTSRGVDVHLVSGNHDTILQYPHVRGVGRLLNDYLQGKMH